MSKFILGDCMDPETGLPSYPDNYFDLFLTDPPYGIDFQSSWRTEKAKRHKKIQNDKTPFTVWIKEAARSLKDGGRMIIFYRWDVGRFFIDACASAGLNVVGEIIWDKGFHGMGDLTAGIAPMHENAIYVTKGRYEFKGSRPKSVYRTNRLSGELMIHPNEKPVWLWEALIRDFTTPGDIICDPFVGSASSLIACESMGFEYVGYEIDPDYYAAAKNRMSKGIQLVIQ